MSNDLLMEHSKSAVFPEGLDLSGLNSISVPNSLDNNIQTQNEETPISQEQAQEPDKLDLSGISPISISTKSKDEKLNLAEIDPISVTHNQHKDIIGDNTLDLTNIKPIRISSKSYVTQITGADVIHHLGINPKEIEKMNPSLRSYLINEVAKAVKEDARKRANGQTEFPVSAPYQNLMRKKIGIHQMKSDMEQYSISENPKNNEDIIYGNHTKFPIVYNIASQVTPETQEVYRNNLLNTNIEKVREQSGSASAKKWNTVFGYDTGILKEKSEEEIKLQAEKLTDQQLAFEEQQDLDSHSKTSQYVNAALTFTGIKLGSTIQNINRGFASAVGGTIEDIGNVSSKIYPTEATPMIQDFGRKLSAGANLNNRQNPVMDPYSSLIENNDLSFSNIKNQIFSNVLNIRKGAEEGIGRATIELPKLFLGAELLGPELIALNLPIQGAISGSKTGPEGLVKGALGGVVYHYGGDILGPYLGRIGNTILWVAAPAVESHLVNGTPLDQAIGESLPTGLFVGVTGGERAQVTDGKMIRSANLLDLPKVASGELTLVPPTFRTADNLSQEKSPHVIEEITLDFDGNKVKMNLAEASTKINDLKAQLDNESNVPIEAKEKELIIEDIKRIQDGIILAKTNGDIDNVSADQQVKINKTLKADGVFNREEFIDREKAYDSMQAIVDSVLNKNKTLSGTDFNSGIPFSISEDGLFKLIKDKAIDFARIVSFNIEDFYHRGIDADYSVVMNRLNVQMPEVFGGMNDKQKREVFDLGYNYWNSNNTDPFFSKMKLDVTEKLSKTTDAIQVRNILKQHQNEFNWTVGLDEFIKDKESKGERISKKELIDIIQRGQVRVEASVAQDNNPEIKDLENQRQVLRKKLDNLRNYGNEEGYYGDKNYNDPNKTQKLGDYSDQLQTIQDKLDVNAVSGKPKYSLKAYSGEKLELPGAVNSKEVKLISPVIEIGSEPKDPNQYREIKGEVKYQAPHWDEPNVVAHYRSNDRTTTDGINIHFSEEFQSDWNHDIRERGLKVGLSKEEAARYEELKRKSSAPLGIYATSQEVFESKNRLSSEEASEFEYLFQKNRANNQGIEPNPFMAHNWKELILKRFIRDSVVAKDENFPYQIKEKVSGRFLIEDKNGGNPVEKSNRWNTYFTSQEEAQKYIKDNHLDSQYKYDGIGWTTARQQAQRYGDILEGKNFKWRKNSDGTYSFDLQQGNDSELWNNNNIHELQNISLERFAELTTKEAAEEVRSQEAKANIESALPATAKLEYNRFTNNWEVKEAQISGDSIEGQGKTKERAIENYFRTYHNKETSGKFSLKEAVELRSGMGTWADYDVALVNMAKKIGKRFGANYSQKEIPTENKEHSITYLGGNEWGVFENAGNDLIEKTNSEVVARGIAQHLNEKFKIEKIHFLEITPSMRQSLEKEGFSIYGLGGSEPLKSQEQGLRNRITTFDLYDEAKNNLVNAMALDKNLMDSPNWSYENHSNESVKAGQEAILNANVEDLENIRELMRMTKPPNTILNSGLNPEVFIDQAKLLYKGISDFTSFSKDLIDRFGNAIKPYLSDLWLHIEHGWETFNAPNWIDIANSKKSTTLSMRFFPDLGKFDPRNTNLPAEKSYLSDDSKHQSELDKRFLMRGIGHAQWDSDFAETYDSMNKGRRNLNTFESNIIAGAKAGNKLLRKLDTSIVGEVIHFGNENLERYNYGQLILGDPIKGRNALSDSEAKAYLEHRDIQDQTLDLKKEEILYKYRKRVFNLNDQLAALTPGTPEYIAIDKQIQYLANRMDDVRTYYDKLKNQGYVSTQRVGSIVAISYDANGDKQYDQFKDRFDAHNWLKEEVIKGADPNTQTSYDIKKLTDFTDLTKAISPAKFEELIEASGFSPYDPAIEKLRDKVYSQFASTGYQLKRDFVSGYDRTWERAIDATIIQAQKYASSFYANVVGDQALISLAKSGVLTSDPNLYTLAKGYIEDEIYSPESTKVTRTLARARRLTSFIQLGWQFNRFIQHAIGKPMSNGLSYFARVENPNNPGEQLSKLEPEAYFSRGVKLGYEAVSHWLATDPTSGGIVSEARAKLGKKLDKSNPTNLQQEFFNIYDRLNKEQTTQPRYVKSLLMMDTENIGQDLFKTGLQKFFSFKQQEHWASVFLRAGERVSRSQTAAGAFLVGKEKFKLADEQLVDFITKAVNAIESNPSRGENPYIVRRALAGKTNNAASVEAGKLAYQFFTFEHTWFENLALNIKSDYKQSFQTTNLKQLPLAIATDLVKNKNAALDRTLVPLLLMGGLGGIPLFKFAKMGYTALTGEDPKKKFDKLLGKNTVLENVVLNGTTGSAGISQKMTPEFPVLDRLEVGDGVIDTLTKNIADTNVPVVATTGQLAQGFKDLLTPKQRLRGFGEIGFFRDIINAERLREEGAKTRSGTVIIPRGKITKLDIAKQAAGIVPNKVFETYEEQKTNKLREVIRKRKLGRKLQNTMKKFL